MIAAHPHGGYEYMGCRCSGCVNASPPATIAGMPKPHAIQLRQINGIIGRPSPDLRFAIIRPGAFYAVERRGEEHRGAWLPEGEPIPKGWWPSFSEREARALLPLLRDLDARAAGKGGRRAAEPTTADGKLVARACKRLGLTAAALAEAIGAHESVLSRARHGELPEAHREAIKALLRGGAKKAT